MTDNSEGELKARQDYLKMKKAADARIRNYCVPQRCVYAVLPPNELAYCSTKYTDEVIADFNLLKPNTAGCEYASIPTEDSTGIIPAGIIPGRISMFSGFESYNLPQFYNKQSHHLFINKLRNSRL